MAAEVGAEDIKAGFETAAQHATPRVPTASPDATAEDTRASLVRQRFDTVGQIVVKDGEQFLGVVRMEELLAAADKSLLKDLMDPDAPTVAPGVDQEAAAWKAVRHKEAALTVVTSGGRFIGVIPPNVLLHILLAEHNEDLTRLGGFVKSTAEARETSLEPAPRRFRHRLPWLLVGLAGSFLAARVVGGFEAQLQDTVMLAFFIPAIVYLADAVGTQTETVVIRGLSVGVSIRSIVTRELLAGLAMGTVLAALGGPLILWWWGDKTVALVVALSLFAACSTATIAAMLLPWLFSLAHRDPAFGSGPLATVVQDLASILIYFAVASALIR